MRTTMRWMSQELIYVIQSSKGLSMVRLSSRLQTHNETAKRAMWRKKETVTHERITAYVTVDDEGKEQELIETDVSRSEVILMERKDTEELARRELSSNEQTEVFNTEEVISNRAAEEYVHLRSLEEDVEFVDNCGTMP
jgi:hypothetical protein